MSTKTTYNQPAVPDVETDDCATGNRDTDAGSYVPPIPIQRKSRHQPPAAPTSTSPTEPAMPMRGSTVAVAPPRRRVMNKPALFLLLGIFLALSLITLWNLVLTPAWGWGHDQWHYGDARITLLDADVGHGGVSHFIGEFYQGQIVVIEIPSARPKQMQVYTIPGFLGERGNPVISLSVRDTNHDGKPDLIVQVEGTGYQTVLYNTGSGFSVSEG